MASREILPSCDMRSIPESACSSTCMTKRFKRPTRRLNALASDESRCSSQAGGVSLATAALSRFVAAIKSASSFSSISIRP